MENIENDPLAPIRARAEAATPGPWKEEPGEWPVISDEQDRYIVVDWGEWMGASGADRNAAFIAHAREDVPALLAALDAVLALHVESKYIVEEWTSRYGGSYEPSQKAGAPKSCSECGRDVPYPCPTVADVSAALGGGE